MTPRTRRWLTYLASALITLLFLYITFRGINLDLLYVSIKGANYWWMLLMFTLMMISHFFRAWRWRYMLNPIKPNIGLRNLFSSVLVGYLMNNLLPRAGELVRPYAIGRLESIPKSAALGTIVVERVMDTVSFLVLVAIVPLVYHGPLLETFPWFENARTVISVGVFAFIVLITALMLRRDWTDALLGLLSKILSAKVSSRLDKIAHSFLDGFLFLKEPRHFFVITVFSVLIWVLYTFMLYVAFFAFDFGGQVGFAAAIVLQAISSIGYAIPTPGGTGTYHFFASQTLARLFHVPEEVALSYATVTHGVTFVGGTIAGLYYLIHDHIKVSEAVGKSEQME
jgi:hypothetical protein